jgi:glucose-6-phosphate isomerase
MALSMIDWQDLKKHHADLVNIHLRDLFNQDPNRFSKFSVQANDILLDYSKQRVTPKTLEKLIAFAKTRDLKTHINALFTGGMVNVSEKKSALHTALRDPTTTPLMVDNQDIKQLIHRELQRIEQFVEAVRLGRRLGATGKRITDVISLGIGGSDLGPVMVCEALHEYKTTDIHLHFISNVDGKTVAALLKKCNPETTLCLINSKSFTTIETHQNAKAIRTWFEPVLGVKTIEHLIAVTAQPKRAEAFGIAKENIFEFWDFIGGRYSVWSAVGLPIALLLGMSHFRDFLSGAYAMDQHFYSAPLAQNMPVLMALLGIWNINFWECATQAIMPYDDGLRRLPDYLQQLEMESNGKKAHQVSGFVSNATAPVIWGGVGCNGQHAYMQLLHQGTQIIPVDFLVAALGHPAFEEDQQLLVTSCFSQSKALMEGTVENLDPNLIKDPLRDAKQCFGNRPSNTLVFSKLTPTVLGSLIALYEHKVFVQGVLWGVNSFDQWGVELGKTLIKEILPFLERSEESIASTASVDTMDLDSSTRGLIDYCLKIPKTL